MARDLVVKTVDINTKRRFRRQPGEIPYPISYSNQMADFDIWDHKFLSSYFGSLTNHRFAHPPSVVLDLGCGTGYWAIEAAQQWQNSRIYGYDAASIQPRLDKIEHFRSLARRIEWAHGNFLDGLPFPSNHFDFVRMAGLGLAIPEDECLAVLEEVLRVMKTGAVLEIIEEELLFPCSSLLLQQPSHQLQSTTPSSPASGHLPIFDFYKNKSTVSAERLTGPRARTLSLATSYNSLPDSAQFTFRPPSKISLTAPPSGPSSASTFITTPSVSSVSLESEHPQDHTRLKKAWDTMLATRFLSPKLLSVIPFYLTSASFDDIKTHSPLVIPLPRNSGNIPRLNSYRSVGSFHGNDPDRTLFDDSPTLTSKSTKTDWGAPPSPASTFNKLSQPDWGTMHLAKTVNTIRGCKEAIWKEYEKLYSDDALYLLSRTAPGEEDYSLQHPKHIARKAFEVDWRNWELDMIDRIGMRNNLLTHMQWAQSIPDTERDRPDWVTWREKLERKSGSRHLITGYNPADSCRSLRVFNAFKS